MYNHSTYCIALKVHGVDFLFWYKPAHLPQSLSQRSRSTLPPSRMTGWPPSRTSGTQMCCSCWGLALKYELTKLFFVRLLRSLMTLYAMQRLVMYRDYIVVTTTLTFNISVLTVVSLPLPLSWSLSLLLVSSLVSSFLMFFALCRWNSAYIE